MNASHPLVDANKELMETAIESAEETLVAVQLLESKYDGIISAISAKAIERDNWRIAFIDKHLHHDEEGDKSMAAHHHGDLATRRLQTSAKQKPTVVPKKQKEPEKKDLRHRRKKCHPAIETKQNEKGEYVVTVKPGQDIRATEAILRQLEDTIERCCQAKRVEQLRLENKRRQWTKKVGYVIGRGVNVLLRRYTESALPFRLPYRFSRDINLDADKTMKEQRAALPAPLSYWFRVVLRNDLIVNETDEMTPQECADTMYHAVYNAKRTVQMSGRQLKTPKRDQENASSSNDMMD